MSEPLTDRSYGNAASLARLNPSGEVTSLTLEFERRVEMGKRKSDYPRTEVKIAAETETGVTAGGFDAPEPESGDMEKDLFEDLVESIKEAGAILRGDREAACRRVS